MKKLLFFLTFAVAFSYEIVSLNSHIILGNVQKNVKNTIFLKSTYNSKQFQWNFPIVDTQQIHPLQFSVKKKFYKVYLKNNRVFFTIFDVKKNEVLEINISYKTLNKQKFLQIQPIALPNLRKKVNAKVIVEVDKNWEIFSQNPLFYKKGEQYIFEGLLDKKPLMEYFWLSLKEANWNINIKNRIYTNQSIESINVLLPKYFKDGDIKVKKMELSTNRKNTQIIQNINNTSFLFNGERTQGFLAELNARITNSIYSANSYKHLKPERYLQEKENKTLKKLAEKIIAKNPNIPFYVAIGQWVYNTLKYDETLVSKHMNSEQILSLKRGVCEHYAQLYNDIIQSISVPSIFVTGVGFNPVKQKFEYHAWNLVYFQDKWIPIDSTWGIFSGKLPVSHIFFYTGYQPLMMYQTYEIPIQEIQTEIEQKIDFIP
ncbi:transglutaminase-like domain-containing protein [Helicobacter anatolicus]|uniref:transglutaminase-like domain-containing protein n=1 Tax=Helicobacter anatolicus TaxID=2905874 RepID=UPI001E5AFBE6|nr:transglutaminase-like domain-containing protein [Helicobacter anatolicus]MCE3039365.1 transglutaminase-like domain-containing protein [Helicobacter anatolicus]